MQILVNYENIGAHWLGAEYANGYLSATSPICTSEKQVLDWAETRAGSERTVERLNPRTLRLNLRVLPHDVCYEDGIRSSFSVRCF